jgi:hypothetical protein
MREILGRLPGRYIVLALAMLVAMLAVPLAPALAYAAPHAHQLHQLRFDPASLVALAVGATSLVPTSTVNPASFSGFLPYELEKRGNLRTFFGSLRWPNLGAGVTLPANLVADINHDIVFTKLAYTARDAGTKALVDRPPLFVEIALGSNLLFTPGNRVLVELESIAGINRGERELIVPLVIPAGETFTMTLTNGWNVALDIEVDGIGCRSARQRQ